jgi:MoaA/NifB/PqqE/SkfB family radical SAM enzyme
MKKNSIKAKALTGAINKTIDYIEKDPDARILRVLNLMQRLDPESWKGSVSYLRKALRDPEDNWNIFVHKIIRDIDKPIIKRMVTNALINASVFGTPRQMECKEKYGCSIPWAILMDPTSACNLRCKGCWAAEYDRADSLSYDVLDRIIREGKELGIYAYLFSGGEPLMRKKDLIRLAETHQDCAFLAFTNGGLVDAGFAKELRRVGNFTLAFSVEGFREETDMRRGPGCYDAVMRGMDLLREERVPFGFSACYHSQNTETVGSDAYIDHMIEKGCLFGWYFTYIPIGKDAAPELMASPEQRAYMYRRMRELRAKKPIFVMDFWNDGEYVNGCIAGGKSYLHINAAGEVEPCAFIHYSNVNIKDVSLIEALQSPLFAQYEAHQPFNENHLRPCPLLDNPEALREMVRASGARSTDMLAPEDVSELCAKTEKAAGEWAPVADELWRKAQEEKTAAEALRRNA